MPIWKGNNRPFLIVRHCVPFPSLGEHRKCSREIVFGGNCMVIKPPLSPNAVSTYSWAANIWAYELVTKSYPALVLSLPSCAAEASSFLSNALGFFICKMGFLAIVCPGFWPLLCCKIFLSICTISVSWESLHRSHIILKFGVCEFRQSLEYDFFILSIHQQMIGYL